MARVTKLLRPTEKGISLSDLDEAMDWKLNRGADAGSVSVGQVYDAVAFLRRAVDLRANAVAALPFYIKHGDEIIDRYDAYVGAVPWLADLPALLGKIEQSLVMAGAAYVYVLHNRLLVTGLRYWSPDTVTPKLDEAQGLVGFERRINHGAPQVFPVDEVAHFWYPDHRVELGPPLSSPAQAALASAGVLFSMARFLQTFFDRGAIRGTLLTVKGNPPDAEKERIKSWWQRTFGGIANAWREAVVNADAIQPVTIGDGIGDMGNTGITQEQRESIAVALGIPMSMLLSSSVSGLGGGGVAKQDDRHFYDKTIRPEAALIQNVINAQILGGPWARRAGLRFEFDLDALDVFQEEEQQRAQAFSVYVGAGMRPEVAAAMLGLDVPTEIPPALVDAFSRPEPEAEEPEEPEPEPEPEPEREARNAAARAAIDLERWQRMAVRRWQEGHPEKALAFDTDDVPLTLAAAIRAALGEAQSVDEVKAVFADAARWEPEAHGLPEPGAA